MNASHKASTTAAASTDISQALQASLSPVLAIRRGRGRLGGSTFLDLLIQRSRQGGRRMKPLDGDLRSGTLATLYPARDADGLPIQDGATVPPSEELPAMKAWLMDCLDEMVEDHVSRGLDLGGGDRVIQEFVRDLSLVSYCKDFGIELLSIYLLGPDLEDFRHVIELVRGGDMKAERTLLVMNEGVIRQGQSVDGAFDPIIEHPDMKALLKNGARSVFLKRLTCMSLIRDQGVSYYDVAEGKPDRNGVRPRATLQHMTRTWLLQNEEEHQNAKTVGWLP